MAEGQGESYSETPRSYDYVGPETIRAQCEGEAAGVVIDETAQFFTFVVDLHGRLRVASRHSEHVQCAAGEPVLAAGEFALKREGSLKVVAVTNLSTGYCPEPASWPSVEQALSRAGLDGPTHWAQAFEFRRCAVCEERNVVKDDWFYCAICGAELPDEWNL